MRKFFKRALALGSNDSFHGITYRLWDSKDR